MTYIQITQINKHSDNTILIVFVKIFFRIKMRLSQIIVVNIVHQKSKFVLTY